VSALTCGTLRVVSCPPLQSSDFAGWRERVRRYEAGWDEVQQLGCVVKDPRIGLVDFYGRIEGRTVWLCWRYGEESIGYYHDLDSGFSGRRALTAAVRRTLVN